jgi:hypothetical protein
MCHLIGQLLGYMVENGRRCGVLSSALRAYFLWIEGDGESPAWSHVCHLIEQPLGYMVENGRRCGVLSSALRAYFLWIEGDDELAEVRISTPWFIGERDFLQALAFVHYMACQQSAPLVASSLPWKMTSKGDNKPTPPPTRKRKKLRPDDILLEGREDGESEGVNGNDMATNGQEDAPAGSTAQMSALVETPIDDVEIIETPWYDE